MAAHVPMLVQRLGLPDPCGRLLLCRGLVVLLMLLSLPGRLNCLLGPWLLRRVLRGLESLRWLLRGLLRLLCGRLRGQRSSPSLRCLLHPLFLGLRSRRRLLRWLLRRPRWLCGMHWPLLAPKLCRRKPWTALCPSRRSSAATSSRSSCLRSCLLHNRPRIRRPKSWYSRSSRQASRGANAAAATDRAAARRANVAAGAADNARASTNQAAARVSRNLAAVRKKRRKGRALRRRQLAHCDDGCGLRNCGGPPRQPIVCADIPQRHDSQSVAKGG